MKIRSLESKKEFLSANKHPKKLISIKIFFAILILSIFLSIISIDRLISYVKLKGAQGPALRSDTIAYIKAIPVEVLKSFS